MHILLSIRLAGSLESASFKGLKLYFEDPNLSVTVGYNGTSGPAFK